MTDKQLVSHFRRRIRPLGLSGQAKHVQCFSTDHGFTIDCPVHGRITAFRKASDYDAAWLLAAQHEDFCVKPL